MTPDMRGWHLFTHAGCMDGSASAILFMHAGGMEKNISFVPAGQVDEYIVDSPAWNDTSKELIFVDIAPTSEETAQALCGRRAIVIDHHITSKKFAGYPGFNIDVENKACGSENFRRWLVAGGLTKFERPAFKRFTTLIDDHDRWQMKIPFSIELPRLFSFVGQQNFTERFLNIEDRFYTDKLSYWSEFESEMMDILRDEQARRFEAVIGRFQVMTREHNGKTFNVGYVISGEINCSELLNTYLNKNPDVDVACQLNPDLNKVSLRSNGKINVSEWAKVFGGGGHKDASGHYLPDELVRKVADLIHDQDVRRG